MDGSEIFLRIGAAVVLLVMLGGGGWLLLHFSKIKRTLVADEAVPKSAPRSNIIVLITTVFLGLAALLVHFIFYP